MINEKHGSNIRIIFTEHSFTVSPFFLKEKFFLINVLVLSVWKQKTSFKYLNLYQNGVYQDMALYSLEDKLHWLRFQVVNVKENL